MTATVFPDGNDTYFAIPGRRGGGFVALGLRLDVESPDLSSAASLLATPMLDALAVGVEGATIAPGYEDAREQVLAAISALRCGSFATAAPLLIVGIEGLYRSAAEARGLIDGRGRFTAKSGRRGRAQSGNDVVAVLPVNERVRRFHRRFAFGGAGNDMRHGQRHPMPKHEQCAIWLVALAAWLDGYGDFEHR